MIMLVRHGEAAASWGAHKDPGLSETGHQQAAVVAEELSFFNHEQIITSPMRRCR
ncbi:MAG: phosphoglycerate mutase family protein, partial [Henriciella sp.]